MSDQTPDLEQLSEQALRDRYTANADAITAIDAKDETTVEDARERRRLVEDSNAVVLLVQEFVVDAPADVADLPITPEPVAEVTPEPEATPAPEPEVTPEIEATVAETVIPDSPAGIETFDATRVEELAAAIAAAADLQTAVNARHQEPEVTETPAAGQTLTASAASTRGGVDAGKSIDLATVGTLVQSLAFDRGNAGIHVPLVTLTPTIAASAQVSASNSRSENTRAFAEAITAAPFDVCGPADILRDVPDCNNVERYVPSWFRTIQSSHGQIEFYRSFGLTDVEGAANAWGEDEQAAVDPTDATTWKECLDIGCLPTDTIGVEAVTQCMCMPVYQVMTSEEAVASAISAIRAATAREADGQLLSLVDAASSQYTFDASATGFGASVQMVEMLGRLIGATAAANREVDFENFTLVLEVGMIESLFIDEMMRCNTNEAIRAAQDLFAPLGLRNIVFTPDWSTDDGAGPWSPFLPLNPAGDPAVAIPERPTDFKVRLLDTSDFAMLAPGGDTFGIVPDLANKRQNKVCWFGEIFQGLGKLGCGPAFSIEVSNLIANGKRAACDA